MLGWREISIWIPFKTQSASQTSQLFGCFFYFRYFLGLRYFWNKFSLRMVLCLPPGKIRIVFLCLYILGIVWSFCLHCMSNRVQQILNHQQYQEKENSHSTHSTHQHLPSCKNSCWDYLPLPDPGHLERCDLKHVSFFLSYATKVKPFIEKVQWLLES